MKKILSILIVVILSMTLFASCGNNNVVVDDPTAWTSLESGEDIFITFAGRDVDTEKANYQAFIDQFNKANPQITATMQWWSDASAYNIAIDGMGVNLPDVFMLSNAMFGGYAASGKLANMKGHVDTRILDDLYFNGYDIYCWDSQLKKVGYTENSGIYGLPKDQGPYALCVNEDLLRERVNEYNTKNPSDLINIDEVLSITNPMKFSYFLDFSKKLKTVMKSDEYICSQFDNQSIVYSNNANFFTDDSATTAAIDSPNFIGAMQFLQDVYKEGRILPAAGESTSKETLFTSGKAIFYYAGPWKQKDYWKSCTFNWNILPSLCGDAEGAVSTSYVGGMCYAISATCKYKDAALELIKFLSTDSSSQRTQYKRGQCIPNLKSLAEEYSNDSEGLIAEASGKANPNPINRSVWIDTVDGCGQEKTDAKGNTYTDKVTGRYRAETYTFGSDWYSNLMNFMGGKTGKFGSFWEAKNGSWVNIEEALKSYKPALQEQLDEMKNKMKYI